MHAKRLEVSVTLDERRGYVGTALGLRPITALSLGGLRRRAEEQLVGKDMDVRLVLDRAARQERDRKRRSDVRSQL